MPLDYTETSLAADLARYDIPAHMHDGVIAYILTGRPVGHFLTAVFSNDLKEAVARSDDENVTRLHQYVRFLYNCAPAGCWGSPKKFAAWRGLSMEV
jgi:hypothetical protein